VNRYAVCYSKINLDEVKNFELLILDPDHYSRDEVLYLKNLGIITIAYLNIAEFETYRSYSIPESIIIGKNPFWKDHFYVDIRSEIWQRLIFDDKIPKIISKEFDGFFIDMIDIVQIFPQFEETIIDMVKLIKSRYPYKFVIANNGWSLIDTLKNFVDAFLVEGLFTRYNFEKKRYFVRFEKEYVDRVKILKNTGKKIFTLDFLSEGDRRKYFVRNLSRGYGFTPYISTIELNKIFK
jgi:uncharacterized protein (TIGR01370 family)